MSTKILLFVCYLALTIAGCANPKQSDSLIDNKNYLPIDLTVAQTDDIKEKEEIKNSSGGVYLAYNLYAGGFHAMTIDGVFYEDNDTNTYNAKVIARPHGWIGKIIRWEGIYASNGDIDENNQLHIRLSEKTKSLGNEAKTTAVEFGPDGKALSSRFRQIENGEMVNNYEHDVDLTLASGAMDLLTAIYTAMRTHDICTTEEPVFDGKKLFEFALMNPKETTLEPSQYNSFNGNLYQCTMDMNPLKGFEKEDSGYYAIQQKSKAEGKQPYLWINHFDSLMGYALPVKMQLKSDFGTVIAHLQDVRFIAPENRDDAFSALK